MKKKKKYYAVRKGTKPGIYEDYEEVKLQLKGFSGSEHQSFYSLQEAEEYLAKVESSSFKGSLTSEEVENSINLNLSEGRLVAFTDGSFKDNISSYGCYILEPNKENHTEISDIVRTDKFNKSQNITAEIMAIFSAFDWALSNGYDNITVFHDYEGIGKWAASEWKANSEISIWFKNTLMDKYSGLLDIRYIKVPAHSNIRYNEEADRLATEARNRNIKPIFKMSDSYFTCQKVGLNPFKAIVDKLLLLEKVNCIFSSDEGNELIYKLIHEKDKITLKFYKSSSKVLAQGKPSILFSAFLSLYTEVVDDSELIRLYSSMYRKSFADGHITVQIDEMNLPVDYPRDVITLIKQSLVEKVAINLNKTDHVYDYCGYVFPACRALEGHIKYLFEKEGVHIGKKSNGKDMTIGNYFEMDSLTGTHKVKSSKSNKWPTINKINLAYNLFLVHRHRLGHFGELTDFKPKESDTYMISDKQVAIDIIDEIIAIIKF